MQTHAKNSAILAVKEISCGLVLAVHSAIALYIRHLFKKKTATVIIGIKINPWHAGLFLVSSHEPPEDLLKGGEPRGWMHLREVVAVRKASQVSSSEC